MMLQNHLIAGYLLYKIVSPPLGMVISFFSHFILDLIPYPGRELGFNNRSKTKAEKISVSFITTFQFILVLAVIALAIKSEGVNLVMITYWFFSALPDVVGQALSPLIKKKQMDHHKHMLIKNPYSRIALHQIFSTLGLAFIFSQLK